MACMCQWSKWQSGNDLVRLPLVRRGPWLPPNSFVSMHVSLFSPVSQEHVWKGKSFDIISRCPFLVSWSQRPRRQRDPWKLHIGSGRKGTWRKDGLERCWEVGWIEVKKCPTLGTWPNDFSRFCGMATPSKYLEWGHKVKKCIDTLL